MYSLRTAWIQERILKLSCEMHRCQKGIAEFFAISVDVRREILISLAICMDVTKNTESILWIAWI
jgi:hypothetical protein